MTKITPELIEQVARDAIAAHIALSEIMPPDRATLLAVADAADGTANKCREDATHSMVVDRRKIYYAQEWGWREFATALRAKAGGRE